MLDGLGMRQVGGWRHVINNASLSVLRLARADDSTSCWYLYAQETQLSPFVDCDAFSFHTVSALDLLFPIPTTRSRRKRLDCPPGLWAGEWTALCPANRDVGSGQHARRRWSKCGES